MQNSINQLFYVDEYYKLVYEYFDKEYTPYISTYYNFNPSQSVIDKTQLLGGSYHLLGDKSGWRWNKILLLPVYFVDALNNIQMTSDQKGLVHDAEISFVIPNSYNIVPFEHDLISFPKDLNINDPKFLDVIFEVISIERDHLRDKFFYKITMKPLKYDTELINNQVVDTYSFVDYFKKIYKYDYSISVLNSLAQYQHMDSKCYNTINNITSLINFNN